MGDGCRRPVLSYEHTGGESRIVHECPVTRAPERRGEHVTHPPDRPNHEEDRRRVDC